VECFRQRHGEAAWTGEDIMTGDLYIQSVINQIPAEMPLRDQIAMELRAHVAERIAQGQPLDEILRQLGDPSHLAESYLASVPLTAATLFSRLVAKLIDAGIVCLIVGAVAAVLWLSAGSRVLGPDVFPWLPVVCGLGAVFGYAGYTIFAEYHYGRTIGKKLMGIRVVQESGTRITLGQAALRQLPFFFQFFFIDALFALFTEKRQRAFELLTKTRAVAVLLGLMLLT
jgi:uncharacterized RDD family membrane protein YckC